MDSSERFTAIFREHRPKVAAYARRRAGEDIAQEIVADTFLAAWRHIDALPSDPLPWLYRAAAFALANRRRETARLARTDPSWVSAPEPRESDVADMVVTASNWRAALNALSENEREILLLAAWEQLSPVKAAAALGCSVVAYRVRLHRARRHLSELIGTGSARRVASEPAATAMVIPDDPPPVVGTGTGTSVLSVNVHLKEA